MKTVKKIVILGVGFMGGSLGLAIRKKFPKISVWGYARSKKSYNKLKKLKILNRVELNLGKCLKNADMVVLALPVETIIAYFKKMAPILEKGAIVFDLGSSKKKITEAAKRYLPKEVDFVGCHPLSGSEKSGAEFSCSSLYRGSLCIISTHNKSTKIVANLWRKLGSRVVSLSPERHDKIISFISHLPHIISFSLTQAIPDSYLKFSTTSFKDLTRISGSPSSVWTDIFISNKSNILGDLDSFIKTLDKFKTLLKNKDKKGIASLIKKANSKQQYLP